MAATADMLMLLMRVPYASHRGSLCGPRAPSHAVAAATAATGTRARRTAFATSASTSSAASACTGDRRSAAGIPDAAASTADRMDVDSVGDSDNSGGDGDDGGGGESAATTDAVRVVGVFAAAADDADAAVAAIVLPLLGSIFVVVGAAAAAAERVIDSARWPANVLRPAPPRSPPVRAFISATVAVGHARMHRDAAVVCKDGTALAACRACVRVGICCTIIRVPG